MSMYTEQEAKAILDKVLALSKADECTATLTGGLNGNIRFALNNVSTSGIVSDADLVVQVAFGKRVGVATINSFDDESLRNVVQRAEELARLAPENEEFMPAIGKQTYTPSNTYAPPTAAISPEYRAKVAASSITPCKADNLIGLKENIIIGKLIPAGTGMMKYREFGIEAPDYEPMTYYSSDAEDDPAAFLASLHGSYEADTVG